MSADGGTPPADNTHQKQMDVLLQPDLDRSRVDLAAWEKEWETVPVSHLVPKHILERIEVAKDLMRYSYFRYGFADAAFLYIMLTYEAALRDKYTDPELDFARLITSAVAAHLVPERYPEWKVQATRKVRNALAHGQARMPGSISFRSILMVIDLINAAYDEVARINAPPVFAREILGRKKNKLMWEALKNLPERPKPGDMFVWVGGEEGYSPGKYECTSCGKAFVLKSTSPELPVCRKCKKGLFCFKAAPEAAAAK